MRPETPVYRPADGAPLTPGPAAPRPGNSAVGIDPRGSAPGAARPGWNAPSAANTPVAGAKQAPLPKRPKGRLFVGFLMLAMFGSIAYLAGTTFFRYGTYGTITGRIVRVSPPWNGIVRSKHVSDGDVVREGQLLLTIDRPELSRKLERLNDELHLAVAELDAEMAQLKWEHQVLGERREKASADYFETWGNLLKEESLLDALAQQLVRSRELKLRSATSDADHEAVQLAESGQRAKVEKIQIALERLKQRAELSDADQSLQETRLRPKREKIDALRRELTRLRAESHEGEIRAPAAGKVVRTHAFSGEQAVDTAPLVELLCEGSLEVVLFVPQEKLVDFQAGRSLRLDIAPFQTPIHVEVTRLGDAFAAVPESLERYYRRGQQVLPVYLRPETPADADMLRLGAEVRLPRELPKIDWSQVETLWGLRS
ncbi:MAG: biotin/lipoyl-binding protein [Planctomycetaceae bacterium]|nr:biotin/lipoyl-binding protein [Planctomycetaceae bacterium]